ncbi:Protein FRA10AC1 [Galdieria sulphuraria]|nr:Protein FRA10AC1 [Galdieria sulphuraria]
MSRKIPKEPTTRPAFNAYEKHVRDINNFVIPYQRENKYKKVVGETDLDVLKREYRFIRESEEEDAKSWETRLARRHYERLYKDYAIAELSQWREGSVGFRWLNQTEVLQGKGYSCCAATDCDSASELNTFEVPFTYEEDGETKATLVKNCA